MTKLCCRCLIRKAPEHFHKARQNSDGLQTVCKACSYLYGTERYRDPSKREAFNSYQNKKYKATKAMLREIKQNSGCVDCKQDLPVDCLQFDHLEGDTKRFNLGGCGGARSRESVEGETNKCEVVCVNCHRIRTHLRRRASGEPEDHQTAYCAAAPLTALAEIETEHINGVLKRCAKCGILRDEDSFHAIRKGSERKIATCKACISQYNRVSGARIRKLGIEYVDSVKSSRPCTDCGVIYPPHITDFDHLDPYTKTKPVAKGITDHWSVDRLAEEIAKCELVCANCHAIRTAARQSQINAKANNKAVKEKKEGTPCRGCKSGFPAELVRLALKKDAIPLLDLALHPKKAERLPAGLLQEELEKYDVLCTNCFLISQGVSAVKDPPKAVQHKTCKQCGSDKPLDDFSRHFKGLHGRQPRCKECLRESAALRRSGAI